MFPAFPIPKKGFWVFCHYSGLRFIWSLIHPLKQSKVSDDSYRKPATFPLWIFGVYVAFFGVASQRYENRVDIIENRANAIFVQLATPIYKRNVHQIPKTQKIPCPLKPEILNPCSIWNSLFSRDTVYFEIVEHLKEIIETWKDSLSYVDLREVDLSGAKLSETFYREIIRSNADSPYDLLSSEKNGHGLFRFKKHVILGANLEGANLESAKISKANLRVAKLERVNLTKADLTESNLTDANLTKADLTEADLSGADLTNTNLSSSDLSGANLNKAYLNDANLNGADLSEVDLSGVFGLTIEQLAKVETLYEAKLDLILMEEVKKKYPHLLEKPEWAYKKPKWWDKIPKK